MKFVKLLPIFLTEKKLKDRMEFLPRLTEVHCLSEY
jgi:hypothetical protein